MKERKEKKSRRYQFAVFPSFGRALDAFCREMGATRTEVFVAAVTEFIKEKEDTHVQGQ